MKLHTLMQKLKVALKMKHLSLLPNNCSVWTRVKLKESYKETIEMKGLDNKKMWTLQLGKQ